MRNGMLSNAGAYRRGYTRGRGHYSRAQRSGRYRADYARELDELYRFAHLLDDFIRVPVVNVRIGLEPILGLIPVVGDLSGLAISGYIVYRAARLGLPRRLVARMVLNVLIDAFIGSIPVAGDLFDVFWKVNLRNMRLLEGYMRRHL